MKQNRVLKISFVQLSILIILLFSSPTMAEDRIKAVMYKPLQCGCCDEYADYLKKHGFDIEIKSLSSLDETKRLAGVPKKYEGCHTLLVDRYAVDGLVPINTLNKLLTEKPDIKGITLPGMPWGAPGMSGKPKQSPLVIYAFDDGAKAPRIYSEE